MSLVITENPFADAILERNSWNVVAGVESNRKISTNENDVYGVLDEQFLYVLCEGELCDIIKKTENSDIKSFLLFILNEVLRWIEEKEKISKLRFYLWKDYEVPDWKEIVVEVCTEYTNLEEEDILWNELEKAIDAAATKYRRITKKNPEEIRNLVSTSIEKFHLKNEC